MLVLLVGCLLVPLAVVARHSFGRDGVTVDPVLTFSLGFLAYWILPVALGATGAFTSQAGMDVWYGLFQRANPGTLARFATISLAAYLAFVVGYLRRRPSEHLQRAARIEFSPVLLTPLFGALLVAAAGFAVTLRDRFFQGYRTPLIIGNGGVHGSFVAVSVALFALAMLRLSRRALRQRVDLLRYVGRDGFFFAYFVVGGLALSLGGRLYMLSSLLMLAAYRSAYEHPIRYRAFIIGGILSVLAAGVIGVVRLGGPLSAETVLFNLAAEPMFTSFSLVNFLADGRFGLIRAPVFLASDFANLIPTIFFPAKEMLLLDPADAGFSVFAPLGALNSFFSFMINFGAVGTAAVLYALGAGLRHLRARSGSAVARTAYSMLTGWLAFTFFRDPFAVSVVKNMFEFSLVMPVLFAVVAHVFTVVTATPTGVTPRPAEARLL